MPQRSKKFFVIAVLLFATGVSLFFFNPRVESHCPLGLQKAVTGEASFDLECALTPEQQKQGLSDRSELPESSAMLFVFNEPGIRGFWMKDMNFPLDIIWIDESGKIIHIEKEAKPESYPKSFSSVEPAKYVLEINAGLSDVFNIKTGDQITFE